MEVRLLHEAGWFGWLLRQLADRLRLTRTAAFAAIVLSLLLAIVVARGSSRRSEPEKPVLSGPQPSASYTSFLPREPEWRDAEPGAPSSAASWSDGRHSGVVATPQPENSVDCSRDETGRLSCGECGIDSDCPMGKGCVLDATSRRTVCLGSNCQRDSDCPTGACVLLTGGTASNAVVRRCASRGDRELNASCLGVGTSNRCAPGLECSIAAGGVCRPSCETSDCPTGQQCV